MAIEKFKLYHYPATRSARVKWMLHEVLEDDFEVEVVHLYEGVQYQSDYIAKNPNHKGNTGAFEYYTYLWDGLMNAK